MNYIIKSLGYHLPIKDEDFDMIFPNEVQHHSERHWTPINMAKSAAQSLVTKPGTQVLDIGSGVGKFCIVGSQTTSGIFHGVEHRKQLVTISNSIIKKYNLQNISIMHSNIVNIDFSHYDSFYFYNSFYENVEMSAKIDNSVIVSRQKFREYRDYLFTQLVKVPIGTRVVTYSGYDTEIPPSFNLVKVEFNSSLKFWIKGKPDSYIPLQLFQ